MKPKAQYVYEYGKRWDARIPRGQISFLINKLHVSTPDIKIENDIRERIAHTEIPDWTPSLTKQSIRYAIAVHRANQNLYRRVTGSIL